MGTVSLTLPSDGQTIDASDVNNPLNALAAEINGNLDNSNIKAGAAIDRSKIAGFTDGWESMSQAPSSITANGNRSYNVVFSSVDLTGGTSPGQRLKLPRTVTAPTQCADLEAGSSQYFNKTSPAGMTFTNNFVCSAWVKLESYGTDMVIVSRYNGTSGWNFFINAAGQVNLSGYNASGSNRLASISYQSIPLNKWVHVAAQLDMTTTSTGTTNNYIMIDGVEVPNSATRFGTNPTALIQAGNLEIGATNSGTLPFDGKLAQVAIYSAKVAQATILASMNQTLTGSETSLISAYSLSNSIVDLNANANNLTAQGSAVATNADTPFTNPVTGTSVTAGTTNYGIIMSQTFSTNTTYVIQVPEGETLPTTGGIGTVSYSTQANPYGYPGVDTSVYVLKAANSTTTLGTPDQMLGLSVTVKSPIVGKRLRITLWVDNIQNSSSPTNTDLSIHLGTVGASTQLAKARGTSGGANYTLPATVIAYYTPTSTTDLTFNAGLNNNGIGTSSAIATATSMSILTAEYVLPL